MYLYRRNCKRGLYGVSACKTTVSNFSWETQTRVCPAPSDVVPANQLHPSQSREHLVVRFRTDRDQRAWDALVESGRMPRTLHGDRTQKWSNWGGNLGYYMEHETEELHLFTRNTWHPTVFAWAVDERMRMYVPALMSDNFFQRSFVYQLALFDSIPYALENSPSVLETGSRMLLLGASVFAPKMALMRFRRAFSEGRTRTRPELTTKRPEVCDAHFGAECVSEMR